MDEAFLKELDDAVSNVGTDEYWDRVIGGRTVRLSPVPYVGQCKVADTLTNADLGVNSGFESKRVTLSYAIVGMSGKDGKLIDLRPWRGQEVPPSFPIVEPRLNKIVKVDLPTYLHRKMAEWGEPWINAVFDVFADLMESHQRENLKEVKFENAKNPLVELMELEEKVRALREQLGKPPLVEASEPPDEQEKQAGPAGPSPPPLEAAAPPFDPFKTVRVDESPRRPPVVTVPVPMPPGAGIPDAPPLPPALAERITQLAALEGQPLPAGAPAPVATVQPPYVPLPPAGAPPLPTPAVPSAQDLDVIESPSRRVVTDPPLLDPVKQSINPRFDPRFTARG